MVAPESFWPIVAFVFGACVGSFLNVVIYRLPRGQTLVKPEHSYCPNCSGRLQAIDLVPLLSFIALRTRCRQCGKPISWRYFWVELLTAALFAVITARFQSQPFLAVALLLFTSALIPIAFIDLATFTIPNSLNLLAFAIPVLLDGILLVSHAPGHRLMFGWLPVSIAGAVGGILMLGGFRTLGSIVFRREAMGLGDVYLARAIGAMLGLIVLPGQEPLRLFPVWLLASTVTGMVVGGVPLLVDRFRKRVTPADDGGQGEAGPVRASALVTEWLAVFLFWDLWEMFRKDGGSDETTILVEGPLDPTAVPFGPYLGIGFLVTLFVGAQVTNWYLATMLGQGRHL
ncbi:MAG: prepilin peptidase [Armatimonadetes bacterium]|nr:prepilin peptidase [Armatimonadota bacterium]MDE2205275.1 prepilin peptidase [Armatimonadota bacterium]